MSTLEKVFVLIDSTHKGDYVIEREIGLKRGTIANWRLKRANPSADALSKIADYFNVSVDYLLGRTETPAAEYEYPVGRIVKFPVIGIITAGYNGEAHEEFIGDISFLAESLHGYKPEECFVLRVSGDSMEPELKNGDLVLIHRQTSVDSGDIAAVMYNGDDATLKRVKYVYGEDWLELMPENPHYPSKRIEGCELEQCRILGRLIDLVSRKY